MKNIFWMISAAMACAATQAQAAPANWPKWYLGLSGDVTFLSDADVSGSTNGELSYDNGYGGDVALGYMLPYGSLRLEADIGSHFVGLDSYTSGTTVTPSRGNMRMITYMGNLYYDLRNATQFTPYIGGGLGMANISLSKASGIGNTKEDDNVLAYQFMTGLAYAPRTLPMTEWSLGYRYIGTEDPKYATATGIAKLDGATAHNLEVGGKFRF